MNDVRIRRFEKGTILAISLCVILAFALLIAIGFYTIRIDSITADKDSQIANLNAVINASYGTIDDLRAHYDALQEQVYSMAGELALQNSTVWIKNQTVSQTAGSYTKWGSYNTVASTLTSEYSGYVSVHVDSTTNNTYVRVRWINTVYGVSYDNQTVVGTSGTANFPVFFDTNLEVRVGNTNIIDNATETVTMTYFY